MELIEYWYLILRRKWIILPFVILFTAAGVWKAKQEIPLYTTSTKLLYSKDNSMSNLGLGLEMATNQPFSPFNFRDDPLISEIEILKTRPILQETADSLKMSLENMGINEDSLIATLGADSAKQIIESARQMMPMMILGKLQFSIVPSTTILQISATDPDPVVAMKTANIISEVFVKYKEERTKASAKAAKEFIESQLFSQKAKLDSAENAVIDYKEDIGVVSLEEETKQKIQSLATLKTQLIQIESQLQGLYAEKNDIQSKINQPGARNSSLYSHWRSSLEQLNTKIASSKAQKKSLNSKIWRRNKELNTIPQKEIKYANLMRDKEIAKNVYTQLLASYDRLRIQEAASLSEVRIIEPAILPLGSSGSQKKKTVALALIAGLMIGFGLALLLEYLDDSPRSVDSVTKTLEGSMLGSIPYFKKLTKTFVKDNSESFAAESLRIIHTNMKFTGALNDNNNAIMLTSSQPGEGKSTISMNLAMTYAELGSKTAVVNMDLRRPSFGSILGTSFEKGITDYLIGDATLEEICYTDIFNGLTVIPAGTIPPNPTVLLGSEKMMELIEILKKAYDFVIFDTPPVTMVSESLDVARHMNGIIQVVDISNASLRAIKYMATVFDGKSLPILGTIVNKMGKGSTKYYGKSYSFDYKKHGYYSDLKKK